MAEGTIGLPADQGGKKLRTAEVAVGANTVEQEVVTPADADGTLSKPSVISNRFTPVSTAKATYTTSGDHTLKAPASGNALRVTWIYLQAKAVLDTGTVLVSITLGSHSYDFELTGSEKVMHSVHWQGGANEALIVNTSSTAAVIANTDYIEFTP